jgi:hypothetical protein
MRREERRGEQRLEALAACGRSQCPVRTPRQSQRDAVQRREDGQ